MCIFKDKETDGDNELLVCSSSAVLSFGSPCSSLVYHFHSFSGPFSFVFVVYRFHSRAFIVGIELRRGAVGVRLSVHLAMWTKGGNVSKINIQFAVRAVRGMERQRGKGNAECRERGGRGPRPAEVVSGSLSL